MALSETKEILIAGLMKLGITDEEDLKVILLTLKTEDNMAIYKRFVL